MKTFRVIKPFLLGDASGNRAYGPGPGEKNTVTEAEMGIYLRDLAYCLTEITAAPEPPKPAPAAKPEPKETA